MTKLTFPNNLNNSDDDRPLPEIVVSELGGSLLYIDRPDGTRLYRVLDWVYEVSGSKAKKRRNPWSILKGRIGGPQIDTPPWTTLEYQTDGGPQTSDFATAEGLYWITQHMSNRSKTTRQIKDFLAKAGVFVDEARREPETLIDAAVSRYQQLGKSDQWISKRLQGKVDRKHFTDALTEACIEVLSGRHYGTATNSIYEGLWGRTASKLRSDLNISSRQSIRDNLTRSALHYLGIAEDVAAHMLGKEQQITFERAHEIVKQVADMIGQQVKQTEQALGIDLPSGRPLLDDGGES